MSDRPKKSVFLFDNARIAIHDMPALAESFNRKEAWLLMQEGNGFVMLNSKEQVYHA